jgi:protein SCO1/2
MTTNSSNNLRTVRRIAWAFVAVLAVFLAATWYMSGRQIDASAEPKPYAVPFTLTDQDGKKVTEKDFLGKPSAWFYGFTHCPDVCPTSLAEMAQVLKELGPDADKLTVVFVSVDPARDKPAALKEYAAYFDPRIVALTGTEEQLRAMTKARYVFYK